MTREPRPFETECRSCGAKLEMRPVGKKDDGSTKWHPFNRRTQQSHYETCPDADQWRGAKRAAAEEAERALDPSVTIEGNKRLDAFLGDSS